MTKIVAWIIVLCFITGIPVVLVVFAGWLGLLGFLSILILTSIVSWAVYKISKNGNV